MEDSCAFENDPIERFLNARLGGALNTELRQTLLAQTTRVLRRRRRLKRIGSVAALVGCYVLGLTTMHVWLATPPITTRTIVAFPDKQASASRKALVSMISTRMCYEPVRQTCY